MEELTFLIVGVLFVLVLVLLSKLGTVRGEVGGLKDELCEILALIRAREKKDRARELQDVVELSEEKSEEDAESDITPVSEEEEPEEAEMPEAAYSGAAPPPLPASQVVPQAEPVQEVARTAIEPKEPSKFETAAREILGKIWNWIVVGEEHRPASVTMEYAIATTWLLRLGVMILVIGIGFFLKYSITQGLIGPRGRVALATLTGVGLLIGGLRLFGGRYSLLGQGLSGAGFATLYFSFFTAHQYELLGAIPAFAVMILVTVASGFVAVRFRTQLIAVLGLLGGYLTPLMITTDNPSVVALFSYLLLLGLGVFAIAVKKEWRLLHYLSFGCTWVLVAQAVGKGFETDRYWTFLPFLVAFFVLFSTVTFVYHLFHKKKSTVLELLFLFLNAGVFFGFAIYLTDQTFSREAVAVITVAMALFYIGHIYWFLKREILDRGLLMSFLGLASLFVAITLPLILSKGWITVSWSVQGFVMLWIAARMRSEFLRQLAYVLYLVVLGRFAMVDLHSEFRGVSESLPAIDYWKAFLERLVVLGLPIASFFAAGFLFSKESKTNDAWIVAGENDIKPWFGQSILGRVCFWIVLVLSFVYLNIEMHHTIGYLFDPLVTPVHTLLCIALAAILLRESLANRETAATVLFWIVSAVIVVKVFLFDFIQFRPGNDLAFAERDFASGLLMRGLNYGMVVAFLVVAWQILSRGGRSRQMTATFGYAALAGAFIYSSLEVWTGLTRFLPDFRMGGLSIFWALFAFGLLLTGISKNLSVLRGLGLLLMAAVIGKVFMIDLSGLDQLYRIIAFIVLGVVVLISSFLYLKYRHRFLIDGSPIEGSSTEDENSEPESKES